LIFIETDNKEIFSFFDFSDFDFSVFNFPDFFFLGLLSTPYISPAFIKFIVKTNNITETNILRVLNLNSAV